MARVGERLREQRETRNTSIADLSQASGIGESYLQALERGEIDALPGPAFGKLHIRAWIYSSSHEGVVARTNCRGGTPWPRDCY